MTAVAFLALGVLALAALGTGWANFTRHRQALRKLRPSRKTSLKKRADDGP